MSGGELVDQAADKAALLAKRNTTTPHGMPEETVLVPGFGTVRVRGLNRFEVMQIQKISDTAEREQHMIAAALIEPTFTRAEAKTWQTVSDANELEPVTLAIGRLSGMTAGADKEKVKGFRS